MLEKELLNLLNLFGKWNRCEGEEEYEKNKPSE